VQKVMSFFVSTYTCESTFSAMNTIKRKQKPPHQWTYCIPHKDCNNKLQIQHEQGQGNACMLPDIPALS